MAEFVNDMPVDGSMESGAVLDGQNFEHFLE